MADTTQRKSLTGMSFPEAVDTFKEPGYTVPLLAGIPGTYAGLLAASFFAESEKDTAKALATARTSLRHEQTKFTEAFLHKPDGIEELLARPENLDIKSTRDAVVHKHMAAGWETDFKQAYTSLPAVEQGALSLKGTEAVLDHLRTIEAVTPEHKAAKEWLIAEAENGLRDTRALVTENFAGLTPAEAHAKLTATMHNSSKTFAGLHPEPIGTKAFAAEHFKDISGAALDAIISARPEFAPQLEAAQLKLKAQFDSAPAVWAEATKDAAEKISERALAKSSAGEEAASLAARHGILLEEKTVLNVLKRPFKLLRHGSTTGQLVMVATGVALGAALFAAAKAVTTQTPAGAHAEGRQKQTAKASSTSPVQR